MKIKIDENLSAEIATVLARLGHDAETVAQEQLDGYSDDALWREVVREGRFLITKDVEFSDARRATAPNSPGIMLVRMGDSDMQEIAARVIEVFASEDVERWIGRSVSVNHVGVRVYPGDKPVRRKKK